MKIPHREFHRLSKGQRWRQSRCIGPTPSVSPPRGVRRAFTPRARQRPSTIRFGSHSRTKVHLFGGVDSQVVAGGAAAFMATFERQQPGAEGAEAAEARVLDDNLHPDDDGGGMIRLMISSTCTCPPNVGADVQRLVGPDEALPIQPTMLSDASPDVVAMFEHQPHPGAEARNSDIGAGTASPGMSVAMSTPVPQRMVGPDEAIGIDPAMMSNVGPDMLLFAPEAAAAAQAAEERRLAQGFAANGSLGGPFSSQRPPPGQRFAGYMKGCTGVVWAVAGPTAAVLNRVMFEILPAGDVDGMQRLLEHGVARATSTSFWDHFSRISQLACVPRARRELHSTCR